MQAFVIGLFSLLLSFFKTLASTAPKGPPLRPRNAASGCPPMRMDPQGCAKACVLRAPAAPRAVLHTRP